MNTIAETLITPLSPLPLTLNSGLDILVKIHMLWRWKTETQEILDNSGKYFAGFGLEVALGYDALVKGTITPIARVAHVGSHLFRLQAQYNHTAKTYQTLMATVTFRGNYTHKIPLTCGPMTDTFFGTATNRWLRIQTHRLFYTARDTLRLTVRLSLDLFELSNRCILVIESTRADEAVIRKIFINTQEISDHLASQNESLLDCLRKIQPFIKERFHVDIQSVILKLEESSVNPKTISNTHNRVMDVAGAAAGQIGSSSTWMGKAAANMFSRLLFDRPIFNLDYGYCPPSRLRWPKKPVWE